MLLEKGADINVKAKVEDKEYSALEAAKGMAHSDIAQILEKAGAEK